MNTLAQLHPPGGKSVILLIEFANEWLAPDAKLAFLMKDNRQALQQAVANAKKVLAEARQADVAIMHATLRLSPDYRELGRAEFGLRGAIPRAGTWKSTDEGWKFHHDFAPEPNEYVIEGRTGASAFANSNLEGLLKNNGIRRLYLAGFATHVCVESTMRSAHDLGYEPVIIADATAAFTQDQQRHVIEHVAHHFGHVISSEGLIALMSETRRVAA